MVQLLSTSSPVPLTISTPEEFRPAAARSAVSASTASSPPRRSTHPLLRLRRRDRHARPRAGAGAGSRAVSASLGEQIDDCLHQYLRWDRLSHLFTFAAG